MADTKIAVLISGRGSNMRAIVEACAAGVVPARVVLVVSNRRQAAGLEWARSRDLPTMVLSHRDFSDRQAHDRAVIAALRDADVEWVCLAGYMRLLSEEFITAFPDRILNIHPSLLPSFPGLDAQRQAWSYGVRVSGCTVHLVDVELDHGPIVTQRALSIESAKGPDEVASQILAEEHIAYPEALQRLLTEPWRVERRRVVFG